MNIKDGKDKQFLMQAYNNLKQEFAKARDPWMLHVPMPRVTEILANSLTSSFSTYSSKEQEKILVPLCISASHSSESLMALMSKLPSDSSVWDELSRSVQEGKRLSSNVLSLMYSHRPSLLEHHLLLCLQELGRKSIEDFSRVQNDIGDECEAINHYLGHSCVNNNTKSERKTIKYRYGFLPPILCYNKSLFNSAFKILCTFLSYCNYSVTSVKTVKLFSELITKEDKLKCCPFEFTELCTLISGPPCIYCNELFSSEYGLNKFAEEIISQVQKFNQENINSLRSILCMNCKWLVFCKSFSTIRTLFLNTDFL